MSAVTILDRYVLRQTIGTLFSVLGVVMSLMILEHLPRLLDITRLSGHRGEIVIETLAGLLPEYAGLGLLVGLYLANALAVRRLALRGELDAIEASGIGSLRWMRWPALLSLVVALVILINQGWLMPGGEQRLDDIGRRMHAGEFGYSVQPNEMVKLGDDRAMTFRAVSDDGSSLENIFLVGDGTTYTAAVGQVSIAPQGGIFVRLIDGQSVNARDRSVAKFDKLEFFEQGQPFPEQRTATSVPFKKVSLSSLLEQGTPEARAAAYGRILWALLALLTPWLGLSLGRPPRRSVSALSLFLGLVLIVLCIKSISMVDRATGLSPELAGLGLAAAWGALVTGIAEWNRRAGAGAFDEFFLRLMRRWPSSKLRQMLARARRRHRPAHGVPALSH
ncbi:LptF/LptG family permease [Croceibacterium aestuarii]|uniref:LptF/LptG family permease n=1 Tax=Croceibacterium aestuarii TaxID=3064139 RepID=UPI00272EC85E|nr:LptF/LptG family permease [Croceibacterium sp. D39]